ncbi:SDR family NAD(P)-dependent oxidoreductase [Nocardioides donggukensis]|uniref:SDR family oxidoreductase n=1 Tax=Nocardioides donggukensis TaxID=2774019 RepID=A0A927K6J1_9ACTN|nr:SDR family oxidoreductase [Nocardioides donggukensis]MBD8870065.1 SDR family oxidoreductase [Nocardioides donggukensis]
MGDLAYDFSGSRVLVTGGTSGLGLTIAQRFLRSGAHVIVTGRQTLTGSYDAPLAAFEYLRLELTDHDSIARVAEEVGPVDVLVNAAGAALPRALDVHEREFVAHSIRLGLIGPGQLTRRLRYRLGESRQRGGGAVVNTQSLRQWFALSHGAAADTEMLDYTARLGAAWGRDGIRVNGVSSTVVTPRQSQLRVSIERHSGPLLTRTRQERTGTLQDVSSSVLFLASSGAAFVTGQTIVVNGGGAGARLGY